MTSSGGGNRQKTGGGGKRGGRRRTSYKPGQSGNPKGRPPLPPDYKLAIGEMGKESLDALRVIIHSPDHPRHEQALEYTINRWKGAPRSHVDLSSPPGAPVAMEIKERTAPTSDDLRRELAALTGTPIPWTEAPTEDDGP